MYIYLVPFLPCRFCGLREPRRRPPGVYPSTCSKPNRPASPFNHLTNPAFIHAVTATVFGSTHKKLPRRTPRELRTIFTSTQFRVRPWWWGRLGSNQRPIGYEPTALTPELRPRETYYSASEVIIEVFQRQFARLLTRK